MPEDKRIGPAGNRTDSQSSVAGAASDAVSVTQTPDIARPDTGLDTTGILAGVLVVVVRTDVDRYRRRVFLSLKAAERSARNARARGQVAEIVLCHLQPVAVTP